MAWRRRFAVRDFQHRLITTTPRPSVGQPLRSTDASAERGAAISIRGLSKRFPVRKGWRQLLRHPFQREWVWGVRGVSCEVQTGEFFGLLGPNGAGKTTLLKMLSTLILPDEGSASVHGQDVLHNGAAVRRLLIPVLADERSLNWRLSAQENLRLFAVLYGLRGAAVDRRVGAVLAAVELADTGEKMVGQFSSGMKQRLLIARALLPQPSVLILDEPTRSLDPISARRFRRFLRDELVGRQGCTVLLATHSSEEALELCDRVAIMNQGRLLAVGSAEALSAELRGERYRIWTREPEHRAFFALVPNGLARPVATGEIGGDGWAPVELEVERGLDAAAEMVAFLTREGVSVARCERVKLPLADLIEQVVRHREKDSSMSEAHA